MTPRSDHDSETRTEISRTTTGLLLLIIGILLFPFPYISVLGGFLEIIGAILVILGRNAFDDPHPKYVVLSVVFFGIGFIVIITSAAAFSSWLATATTISNRQFLTQDSFSSAIDDLLIGVLIGGAVTGLALVLLTHALQRRAGRIFLWLGYIATLALGIGFFIFEVLKSGRSSNKHWRAAPTTPPRSVTFKAKSLTWDWQISSLPACSRRHITWR